MSRTVIEDAGKRDVARGAARGGALQATQAPAQQKTCTDCNRQKPLDSFSPLKAGRYGRTSICKPCMSARVRVWQGSSPVYAKYLREMHASIRKSKAALYERRKVMHGGSYSTYCINYAHGRCAGFIHDTGAACRCMCHQRGGSQEHQEHHGH